MDIEIRAYESIEPMPTYSNPQTRVWWVVGAWLAGSGVMWLTAAFTASAWGLLALISYAPLAGIVGRDIGRTIRASRRFHRDLTAWSKRADAYHAHIMSQIQARWN